MRLTDWQRAFEEHLLAETPVAGTGFAATLLVASTVAAFFSVNAWIWVVMHGLG